MTNLNDVMLAYEAKSSELEEHHDGKWVLVCDDRFLAFDDLVYCAGYAARHCANKPYMIRLVGAQQAKMPISVFYHAVAASEQVAPQDQAA
jgi:hypothetical protein